MILLEQRSIRAKKCAVDKLPVLSMVCTANNLISWALQRKATTLTISKRTGWCV
jgi:hypothetical protein